MYYCRVVKIVANYGLAKGGEGRGRVAVAGVGGRERRAGQTLATRLAPMRYCNS